MAVDTRVAVVTGGGRGIGRGITFSLAELGFALVVNYRSGSGSRGISMPLKPKCEGRRARSRVARRRGKCRSSGTPASRGDAPKF